MSTKIKWLSQYYITSKHWTVVWLLNSCLIDLTDFNLTIILVICISKLTSCWLKMCNRFPCDIGETLTFPCISFFLHVLSIILDFFGIILPFIACLWVLCAASTLSLPLFKWSASITFLKPVSLHSLRSLLKHLNMI